MAADRESPVLLVSACLCGVECRLDGRRHGLRPEVVAIAAVVGAVGAVLKARSPSCGVGEVYDGTFTHTVCPGSGVTAAALQDVGLAVWTEEDASACISALLGTSELGAT